MREFKFRAWNGYNILYNYLVARPQYADCLSIMTSESFARETYKLKDWVVMQFTGLHDKANVEIYEGDIVEGTRKFGWGTDKGDLYVVKWNQQTCSFELCPNRVDYIQSFQNANDLTFKKSKICAIVGNIYETPNLLK